MLPNMTNRQSHANSADMTKGWPPGVSVQAVLWVF